MQWPWIWYGWISWLQYHTLRLKCRTVWTKSYRILCNHRRIWSRYCDLQEYAFAVTLLRSYKAEGGNTPKFDGWYSSEEGGNLFVFLQCCIGIFDRGYVHLLWRTVAIIYLRSLSYWNKSNKSSPIVCSLSMSSCIYALTAKNSALIGKSSLSSKWIVSSWFSGFLRMASTSIS